MSVTDLIINEIANVLGIPPSEVKSKFTEAQLKELYNLSLCEPIDEVGAPFGQVNDLPCEEPAPQLLPPVSTKDVENILKDLENASTADPVKKCVDSVKQVSSELDKERELYIKYSLLYDKLIEYQDNFEPISYYFEERASEMARVLKSFGAVLNKIDDLNSKKLKVQQDLESLLASGVNTQAARDQRFALLKKIDDINKQLASQRNLLTSKTQSIPVFSNNYYTALLQNLDSGASQNTISQSLNSLYKNYISLDEINKIQNSISQYSQCIKVIEDETPPANINQAGAKAFFKFSLLFPKLLTFKNEVQTTDPNTGETSITKTDFPIKGNPLLQKQTFFTVSPVFTSAELALIPNVPVIGKIYTEYYNLLADPLNNFFTLDDRGLSTQAAAIDPRVRGTDSEKKRENNSEYFVKDLDKLQSFYRDFEATFEAKKAEKRAQVITPSKDGIRALFRNIARREVQLLLSLGRVNKFTPESSSALRNIVNGIKNQNESFINASTDLTSEIARIKKKLEELKPNPQKIKERLKKQSPDCFDKIDQQTQPADCGSVMDKMGTDPLYLKSITQGVDPTLPCSNQLCYWAQFSIIANVMGLLPMPNVPQVTQLRYWPVGLTIPSPAGLIKIPLPVIWIPLVVLSTPMGNLVIFLTINGIFISPIIFFISSSGYKQHIFTVRGPSPKFGFSANEESIKPGIQKSVAFLAAQEKLQRLAKEAAGGKEFNLSPKQKAQLEKQRNILKVAEADANKTGNKNKKLRVAREKKNLEESINNSKLGANERLQNILDRTESAKDAVEDAKRAIHQRINDLGRPILAKSNELKAKISKRQDQLLLDLQKSLEAGDDAKVKEIREKMKSDGISMNDKVDAIKADMRTYFDKLQFPKIAIPKNSSKLEPKPNAIVDFLYEVLDFASIYKSNFFSVESLKLKSLLSIQLAKSKNKIKKKIESKLATGESIDIEKDFDKIQQYLLDINGEMINRLKGEGGSQDAVKSQASKVEAQKKKVKNEKDPKKKKDLEKELEGLQTKFSDAFDNARVKEALALTPEILAALSQLKVDFNPFAPCCAKSGFQLDLGALSPAIPIIESVKILLDSYVKSLTPQQFKSLAGGKKTISPREMTSTYLGIIKNAVPGDIAIPIPGLNLLTFAKSFAGVLTSLFEIKAPNSAALPALPARVQIDLNLIKPILLEALLAFLANCLPDPNSYQQPAVPQTSAAIDSNTRSASEIAELSSQKPGPVKLDSGITIVDCAPDDSQTSAISSGGYNPNARASVKVPTSSSFSSGNVIASSSRDVLLSFSTLDLDFLSINPSDLLAVLKNFVDMGFDVAENVLDTFYTLVKVAKSSKGANLNLLESIQPQLLPITAAVTSIKAASKSSNTIQIMDTEAIDSKLKTVENLLGPIANSPLPTIVAVGAGIADRVVSVVPIPPVPKIDPNTKSFSMVDNTKPSYAAIRALHPLVSQDDIPSWERLSPSNPLFLLFVDEFLSQGADKVGLFRDYV